MAFDPKTYAHPTYHHEYYVANKEKALQQTKEWRQVNPDKCRNADSRWKVKNRDRMRAADKDRYWQDPGKARARVNDYHTRNRESARANTRRWYAENKERSRGQVRLRRARKLDAAGTHTFQQWMLRVEYFGWRCRYCNLALTFETLTQDHAIPLSRGGSEWASNLLPACRTCNSRKHAKTFFEFVRATRDGDRRKRAA